jgi:sugar phosphate isomerase/epimerase
MGHQYFLIGFRTTTGKRGYKFIDITNGDTLKGAIKDFERRNNFKKLLEKYDLTISKAERFYQ